jgi:Gas vesicle synthesis protein GvpL/GvpF
VSLLLYAIADADPNEIDGIGIGQAPLRAVGQRGLLAVVAERPDSARTAEDASSVSGQHETLWEYERVIERLMASHPVLPARFGTVLSDEAEAQALLESREHGLGKALRLVRDAVELGLRVGWRTEPETGPESGTAYMTRRLGQLRRARDIAEALTPLHELARASQICVAPRPELAVAAAYLVDRSLVSAFADKVARLDRQLDDAVIVCTGPWPPYSFADSASEEPQSE